MTSKKRKKNTYELIVDKNFNDGNTFYAGTKVKEIEIDADGLIHVETIDDDNIKGFFWINKEDVIII